MKTLPLLLLLAAGAATILRAADVNVYAVTKAQSFTQTATSAPMLPPTGGITFVGIIDPKTATSVTGGTLRLPSAVVKTFGPVAGLGPWVISEVFDTLAAMNAVYGSGTYRFTINALNDGTRTPGLALNGNVYPSIPTVTNIAAAQNIDWTQPFTLQWSAFTGASSTNTIQLIITRKNGATIFETPRYPASGSLNSSNTSVTIPANTFIPGDASTATLAFGNLVTVDIFSYGFFDGVPGVAAFIITTGFPIKAPGTPPILQITKGAAAGSYDLTWNSDVGREYDLVSSQDLVTWTRVALLTATATTTTRTDTPALSEMSRFYRLQDPP